MSDWRVVKKPGRFGGYVLQEHMGTIPGKLPVWWTAEWFWTRKRALRELAYRLGETVIEP